MATRASHDDVLAVIESTMTTVARRSNLPRSHQRLMARAGVSIDRASYAMLVAIADHAPVRLTDLAASMAVDGSTACRQINALETRGLIAKVDDPDDRRSSLLALSGAGRKLLSRVRTARRAAWAELLADWPAADLGELCRLLDQLATDLDDANRHGGTPTPKGPSMTARANRKV